MLYIENRDTNYADASRIAVELGKISFQGKRYAVGLMKRIMYNKFGMVVL